MKKRKKQIQKKQEALSSWFYLIAVMLAPIFVILAYYLLLRQDGVEHKIPGTVCPSDKLFNFNNFQLDPMILPMKEIKKAREISDQEYNDEKKRIDNFFNPNVKPIEPILKNIQIHILEKMAHIAGNIMGLCKRARDGEAGKGLCQEAAMLAARNAIKHQLETGIHYTVQVLSIYDNNNIGHTFTVFGADPIKSDEIKLSKKFTLQDFINGLQNQGNRVHFCDGWDKFYGMPKPWFDNFSLKNSRWKKVVLFNDYTLPDMKKIWKLSDKQIKWYKSFLLEIIANNGMQSKNTKRLKI